MSIEITSMTPQIAVALKKEKVAMQDLMTATGCEYEKILGYLAENGANMVGAPYLYYTNPNEDYTVFDVEFGIPVDKDLPTKDEFFMSKSYGGECLVGAHKGSYATIDETYEKMFVYAEKNAVNVTGNTCYDYYLNDPSETPEEELLTQVVFPIK